MVNTEDSKSSRLMGVRGSTPLRGTTIILLEDEKSMDRISEQDSNYYADYAYYAKQFWGEDQIGKPIFIVLISSYEDMKKKEIFDTWEGARDYVKSEINKGNKFDSYSIHSLSYPLDIDDLRVE